NRLPHGPELSQLQVLVATRDDLNQRCGNDPEIRACYLRDGHWMIVPDQGDPSVASMKPSVDYLVAHEYGHHVAVSRSNSPWPGAELGPKRWASYVRACDLVNRGLLTVGPITEQTYHFDPMENWAEVYARLTFPSEPWTFA